MVTGSTGAGAAMLGRWPAGASAHPPARSTRRRSLGEYASQRAGDSSGTELVRGFFAELEGLDGVLRQVRLAAQRRLLPRRRARHFGVDGARWAWLPA